MYHGTVGFPAFWSHIPNKLKYHISEDVVGNFAGPCVAGLSLIVREPLSPNPEVRSYRA